MSTMVNRMRFVVALVAMVGLAACVPGPTRTDDARFAGVGRTIASPSGAFGATLVERQDAAGTRLLVPTIVDAAGSTVFEDDAYGARHKLRVLWQSSGDVLWVYSGDVGTSRIDREAGAWRKTQTRDGMPADVREALDR